MIENPQPGDVVWVWRGWHRVYMSTKAPRQVHLQYRDNVTKLWWTCAGEALTNELMFATREEAERSHALRVLAGAGAT